MKAYPDLKQSKKLAEILPIESVDMYYSDNEYPKQITKYHITYANVLYGSYDINYFDIYGYVPCWSLAALFDILPDDTNIIKDKSDTENERYMCTVGIKDDIISTFGNNPVDACYEMILKLHELNLL